MTATIAAKTLRDQRRGLIGWAIGMTGLVLMYSSFFPSIQANAAKLNDYMKSLPEAVRNLVGQSGGLATSTGYLRGEIFGTLGPLLLLILAIGAGSRAVAGEEEAHTLDLLLANPVNRRDIVLEKAGAMVLAVAAVGAVLWLAIVVVGPLFGIHVSFANLAATCLSAVLLAIAFGSLSLLVGCITGRRSLANAVSATIAVVMFLLNILAPSVTSLEPAKLASFFYYYLAHDPLRTGVWVPGVLVLLGASALAVAAAAVVFERRDLAA